MVENKQVSKELTEVEILENLIDELNRARDVIQDNEIDFSFVAEMDNLNDEIFEIREKSEYDMIDTDTLDELIKVLNKARDMVVDNEIDYDLVSDIDLDIDRIYDFYF